MENNSIKQAIRRSYKNSFQQKLNPFVYLSISVPSKNVDVNVHPTKQEVHILNEKAILTQIEKVTSTTLENWKEKMLKEQPNFFQTNLNNLIVEKSTKKKKPSQKKTTEEESIENQKSDTPNKIGNKKPSSQNKASSQRLSNSSQGFDESSFIENDTPKKRKSSPSKKSTQSKPSPSKSPKKKYRKCKSIEPNLLSVKELLIQVSKEKDRELVKILKNHQYLGVLNPLYSLIQYKKTLYKVNHQKLSEELIYQCILRQFGEIECSELDPPLDLIELFSIALDSSSAGYDEANDGPKENIIQSLTQFLTSKSDILLEYWNIGVNKEGKLISLPYVLFQYLFPLHDLPLFLLEIVYETDWNDELPCFRSVSRRLANFLSVKPSRFSPKFSNFMLPSEKLKTNFSSFEKPIYFKKSNGNEKPLENSLAHFTSHYHPQNHLFASYDNNNSQSRFYLIQGFFSFFIFLFF